MIRAPRCLTLALLSLFASSIHAGPVREEILSNGLRVVLVEHHANPMICSSVVVGAGVAHEPEGMNGASHFLEHLLFNGTEKRSQRELYDAVDRIGGYNNATTREDHTLFTFLAQKEFAQASLEIQSDMLFHSILPPDKFEKEKGIVLEEIAKDRTEPSYVAEEAFRAFAYRDTPLARAVLGTEESIRGLERDRVMAYYKARYVPANMMLVVMGDFEPGAMLDVVKRTFGAASAGKSPRGTRFVWPDPSAQNLALQPLDAGRGYVSAQFPLFLDPFDPRLDAAEILLSALADGRDAPLARELLAGPDPLAISFSLGIVPRALGLSSVEFEATVPEGRDAAAVLRPMAEAIRALAPGTAAWDRVAAVQNARRADEALTQDNIQYYAMTRSSYLLGSPSGYLARRLAGEESVEGEDLAEAARMLREGAAAIRASHSARGLSQAVTAWTMPPLSPPGPRAGAEHVVENLESGLVVLAARNDDSRVFGAHLLLRPRSASEPEGKEGIADFLSRLLLRGTIARDAASLSASLDALGARIKAFDDPRVPYDDYYTTPEFSFVRLEMPADRWREGVSLLAEMVRFPAILGADVDAVRKEMLDLQRRRLESPRTVAADLVSKMLAPGHSLARPVLGTEESVSSITEGDLKEFHSRYVSGRGAILTVVGPVDPRSTIEAIRAAFGGLPPGPEVASPPAPPVTPPERSTEASLGKGQAQIALAYLFDAEGEDEPALAVAGALLSDELGFHLREERGLAYAMSASIAPWGGRMRFEASMGTRPTNVEEALEGLRKGIADFVVGPKDAGKVERAVHALRGRLLMRRMTRVNQAYFAGLDLMRNRPPGDGLARLEKIRAVTADDVDRVVRKYVDPGRCAVAIVR